MNEQLKIIITATTEKLKSEVEKAKKSVGSFKDKVDEASKSAKDTWNNIGNSIASGLKTGLAALAGLTTAVIALAPATEEYRNSQAKLNTAFENAGSNAAVAKDTYNDLYRVLGENDTAVEAANHLALLTTNEKELQQWTNICQGVYATFGDSLPIEGLTEAANETAKVGTVTGTLADALNWAGVSEDAFNEKLAKCNTEAEREKVIRETLNGLYDEASKKFEENNAYVLEQNEAQAKLNENLALVGEAVAPVVTEFTKFANEALAIILPYVQDLAENYMPMLSDVLGATADGLKEAFEWASQNKELLMVIGGIIAGVVTAIGLYNLVQGIKTAMDAAQTATLWGLVSAQLASAGAALAAIAPYLLIVAAIALVIAAIVWCVENWDLIKETVAKVWQSMKEKVSAGVDAVKGFIGGMVQNMKDKINGAKDAVLGTFDKIKNGIKDKISAAKDTVKGIIDTIKGFFGFKITWPKIPMPTFGITPKGWGVGDLLKGKIPKLSINWNAQGGVFDKPTLTTYGGTLQGLGEAGAEAIVPLEKNTQWLDKIADKLAARSAATPIVLQVDGKTFAQTAIGTINDLTKQTGTLQLALY